jgi:hypothetical protein
VGFVTGNKSSLQHSASRHMIPDRSKTLYQLKEAYAVLMRSISQARNTINAPNLKVLSPVAIDIRLWRSLCIHHPTYILLTPRTSTGSPFDSTIDVSRTQQIASRLQKAASSSATYYQTFNSGKFLLAAGERKTSHQIKSRSLSRRSAFDLPQTFS